MHPRVSPGVLAGPIMLAWSSSLPWANCSAATSCNYMPKQATSDLLHALNYFCTWRCQPLCSHMAVTRKQLAISVRFVELHVFFLMEAKPDASFTFPQVHFLNPHIRTISYICWFRRCLYIHTEIQNGSEWFFSAGSAVELLCSSMLVYGKFFVHGIHSTYTAYTAVLAQRRSTVAPNFGPLRHQSCQWLNMLWYVVAQCGTMWLTPRLPA